MLQGFVALPDDVKVSIASLVFAIVALVLNFLIARVPWLVFLKAYQEEWSAALAVVFTAWLENVLPVGYESVSITGVTFLLAVVFLFVPYLIGRKALNRRGLM